MIVYNNTKPLQGSQFGLFHAIIIKSTLNIFSVVPSSDPSGFKQNLQEYVRQEVAIVSVQDSDQFRGHVKR